jgi:hypothetical protein
MPYEEDDALQRACDPHNLALSPFAAIVRRTQRRCDAGQDRRMFREERAEVRRTVKSRARQGLLSRPEYQEFLTAIFSFSSPAKALIFVCGFAGAGKTVVLCKRSEIDARCLGA